MEFTAKDVAKLREQTGAGMMDCKKALTATNGDMQKAADYLRERGVSVAAKKASRLASEGAVSAAISADKKIGALVEINCESDFVAKSDEFQNLCIKAANAVIDANPSDLDALLAVKTAEGTVLDLVNNATAKIGEKIAIRRFVRYETTGKAESYIHMGGKIGVLVDFASDKDLTNNAEFADVCHDVAMHIAAFSPKYVKSSDVPADEAEHEKAILKQQALNEGKPEAVVEKMIEGRIKKFYKEICLVEQEFAKDATITVGKLVDDFAKKAGANVSIVKFERFVMGEGLEKKSENLADEIAKIQNS